VKLEIEPGRFLVAESGVLVSQVRAVKQMGSRHFVLVDAGKAVIVLRINRLLTKAVRNRQPTARRNGLQVLAKTNTGGENSKHGIWHSDLPLALAAIQQHGLQLVGLQLMQHIH
jgi:diaminopimelate decarboxylase